MRQQTNWRQSAWLLITLKNVNRSWQEEKKNTGSTFRNFILEVLHFLNFHPRYTTLASQLARLVTELATPVGSGTVARTERIPLEERSSSAVIAWMRHQTSGYDRMVIAPVKGRRRQVRRELAARSLEILQLYRDGNDIPLSCPLQKALAKAGQLMPDSLQS